MCNPNRRNTVSKYTRFQAQLDEILHYLVVSSQHSCLVRESCVLIGELALDVFLRCVDVVGNEYCYSVVVRDA